MRGFLISPLHALRDGQADGKARPFDDLGSPGILRAQETTVSAVSASTQVLPALRMFRISCNMRVYFLVILSLLYSCLLMFVFSCSVVLFRPGYCPDTARYHAVRR